VELLKLYLLEFWEAIIFTLKVVTFFIEVMLQ